MEFMGRRQVRMETSAGDKGRLDIDSISDPNALTNNLFERRWRNQNKGYNYLRMSEVDGACPREWVIGHLMEGRSQERIGFGNLVAMNMGSALHFWLQNYGKYWGDRFIGFWECFACGSVRKFGVRPNTVCEHCGASPRATFYKEYMYRNKVPYRVVSKIDGILQVSDRHRFMEIKTTKERVMDAPIPRDVAQVSGYLKFYEYVPEEKKLPIEIDTSVGYIFYFKKMFDFSSPIATFKISRDSSVTNEVVTKAKAFTDGINGLSFPEALTKCSRSSFLGGKAKNCAMARICQSAHQRNVEVFKPEEYRDL